MKRIQSIGVGNELVGNRIRVKVVKNKIAPPFREAEFDMMFDKGISRAGCILDMAVERGFITKSGNWFSYKGENIGQGRESAKSYLENNPQITLELEEKIRNSAGFIPQKS
jgi:recombination protein RecA